MLVKFGALAFALSSFLFFFVFIALLLYIASIIMSELGFNPKKIGRIGGMHECEIEGHLEGAFSIPFFLVPFGTDRAVEDAYSVGICLARRFGRNDGNSSLVR